MTPAEQTFLSRLRPNSAHRQTVQNMFGLSARLANERTRLEANASLSDVGRREQAATLAKSLAKNLAELSRPLRRAKADAAAARSNFTLPAIDKTDVVGEMKRAEIRAYVRSLPLADKMRAVESLDDAMTLAILDAPAMLSGLPQDRYEHIKSFYLERQFGSQIRALESDDEDLEAVGSAGQMVRRNLQVASGLSDADFLALENTYEH